jgi:hypothetical protein
VLQSLAAPEVGDEYRGVACPGGIIGDDQTGKDPIEVPQDLVLQHGAHFDLAQPDAIQVLELQVNAGRRSVEGSFPPAQQVTDGCGVDLIRLFTMHHLLIPVLADSKAVDQPDGLGALDQMARQILKVMACRLHADQNQLRLGLGRGSVDGLAQLIKTMLQEIDLASGCHDIPQGIVNHRDMKVLANVQGDAQDLIHRDTPDLVSEFFTPFTSQVGMSTLAHGWYLLLLKLLLRMPTGVIRTGQRDGASPALVDGLRSRRMVGRRYFIHLVGSVDRPQLA